MNSRFDPTIAIQMIILIRRRLGIACNAELNWCLFDVHYAALKLYPSLCCQKSIEYQQWNATERNCRRRNRRSNLINSYRSVRHSENKQKKGFVQFEFARIHWYERVSSLPRHSLAVSSNICSLTAPLNRLNENVVYGNSIYCCVSHSFRCEEGRCKMDIWSQAPPLSVDKRRRRRRWG